MYLHTWVRMYQQTNIEILVDFSPVLSPAASDEHQLALQVPQLVQGVGVLGQLLVPLVQPQADHLTDAVEALSRPAAADGVVPVLQDAVHLAKGGDLDRALGLLHTLVPLQLLVALPLLGGSIPSS